MQAQAAATTPDAVQVDYSVLETLTQDGLAQILAQLQQPDTTILKQATALLKQYFKSVKALENLLLLMANHNDQVIRQLATVYLRKLICKHWMLLPENDQTQTKNLLLERFVAEPIPVVKKNIADVIGQLGKLLIPQKAWPELFALVFEYTQAESLEQKELAMMLLSVMIEYFSASDISTYYSQLNPIIMQYLQSQHPNLKRLAVVTVNNLTQTGHAVKVLKEYPELIPLVLNAIDIEQEDLIQTIFETLTDFIETPKILRPHLSIVIEAAISLSVNSEMSLNVRSTTLYFLEQLGDTFAKHLVKKDAQKLQQIIECGCTIACEDVNEYPAEEENPVDLALIMLYSFASELPNEIAYGLFKAAILNLCNSQDSELKRMGGIKILGQVCDSDALLDPIKDDVELYTDILISGLQDSSQMVREAACVTIGEFSEDCIPDFLEQHTKVMPVLLQTLQDQIQIATTSEDHANNAERAIYALGEFATNMEEYEIKPYLSRSLDICLAYLNGPTQHRKIKYMALNALSPIIICAEHHILPRRDELLQAFFNTIQNATTLQDQSIKGKALMCAGNLASTCSEANFPQEALEAFTRFALECLQQADAKYELKETAINYFSEISKIQKSKMANLIPIIVPHILESAQTKVNAAPKMEEAATEFDLDSDDDDEENMMVGVDLEGIDEQVSAIHCLGNLSLYCSGLMQPHLQTICDQIRTLGAHAHDNVKYHVCLTLTQIGFGILKLNLNKQDDDEKLEWHAGLPVMQPLPHQVKEFNNTILYPHLKELLNSEMNKEVVEKVIECIRDLADEMGPDSVVDHLEWIVVTIEQLLDKTAPCQTGQVADGPNDQQDEEEEDSEAEEDDEDLDHDELILGNATDLIVALAKCLQDSFMPYMQRLGPKLVKYLGDDHPKSDKIMIIGCLGETFNQCPAALNAYFNDFIQVLFKHSTSSDGSINRNVSYGIAIVADKASVEQFSPHLSNALAAIKAMHTASEEDDAKDNCVACIVRILERYHDKMPQDEYNVLFQQIMSAIPFEGDPSENQTVLKFIMNINATQPDKVLPYMDKITLVCLKLLTDSRCKRDLDENFKVLTAKFIKNVIMDCGRPEIVQQLQAYEGQMSDYEKADLQKYMAQVQ